jgi:hypothetical protein
MSKEETLAAVVEQYNDGAITATEMLNKMVQVLGSEAEEFW